MGLEDFLAICEVGAEPLVGINVSRIPQWTKTRLDYKAVRLVEWCMKQDRSLANTTR